MTSWRTGALEQWAGQQVDVAQLAAADAVGAQALDSGVAARGTALASALVVSDNEQSVVQHGQLGDGLLVQWSGQLIRRRPDRRRERAVEPGRP